MKNKNFQKKLKTRWDEVKEELYKTAIDTIDSMSMTIKPSADYNFTVWENMFGNTIQYESATIKTLKTYEEQVEYLRWFIETRFNWINNEIAKY